MERVAGVRLALGLAPDRFWRGGLRLAGFPRKQLELAQALGAPVFEVTGDHGAAVGAARRFNPVLLRALEAVGGRERVAAPRARDGILLMITGAVILTSQSRRDELSGPPPSHAHVHHS